MIYPRKEQTAREVARHYDALDALYREIWGDHVHHGLWTSGRESVEEAVVAVVKRAADAAGIGAGDEVCDIGCGYGATSRWIVEHRGAVVTGLTVSERQYAYASARSVPRGPVILLRDWLVNGFEDGAFDALIAVESLAHMPDKERFFLEAARTLRPGGRLVLCPWMAADDPRPWQVRLLLEPICREGRIPSLGSEREYRAMMRNAGFRVVRLEDWSLRARRTWTLVAFRTGAFRYGILVGEKPCRFTSSGGASQRGARAGSAA